MGVMENLKGIIIKDDARYSYTEDFLKRNGYVFADQYNQPDLDFIIFPFKEDIDKSIFNDAYFQALRKNTLIFSGLRHVYIGEKCKKYGLGYHVIMEDRGIAIKNAVPTSEGVIAYLIGNRDYTVANSRILIIGYGVCGSDLSKKLKSLGAKVYALVRSRDKECAAYADSITPVYRDDLNGLSFDVYINTAPDSVLDDEMLETAGGSLFIDIASKPGFNMGLARRLNEKSAQLPGIPGKYAVRAAGEIIGEYVYYILSGRDIR